MANRLTEAEQSLGSLKCIAIFFFICHEICRIVYRSKKCKNYWARNQSLKKSWGFGSLINARYHIRQMKKELKPRYSKIKIDKKMVITRLLVNNMKKWKERKFFFLLFFSTHDMNLRCSNSLLLLEKDLTKNQTWYAKEYLKALNLSTISPRGDGVHTRGNILVSA